MTIQEQFIGKTVSVRAPIGRDIIGRRNGSMVTIIGDCVLIGPNPFLGYALQVTIGRTPIELQSINQLTIVEPKLEMRFPKKNGI